MGSNRLLVHAGFNQWSMMALFLVGSPFCSNNQHLYNICEILPDLTMLQKKNRRTKGSRDPEARVEYPQAQC